MTHRAALLAFTAAGLLLATRAAAAGACVEVDTERDTLSDAERAAARSLLIQALESNGQKVNGRNGGCTAVYRVSNVRLGNSVSTSVNGPQGTRSMQLRAVEDLPNAYDQIVKSLVSGQPLSNSGATVSRDNVTANQAAPRRAAADSLWYARLGYGYIANGAGGPAIGFGYRYELDSLGVDLSFINLTFQNNSDKTNISGSWIRLAAYYFADPKSDASLYAGGGLAWGGSAVTSGGNTYSGSGIQGELTVGYEFLRASTIRLFVQADASLPFYNATFNDSFSTTGVTSGSRYTPTVVVSLGGSFGRSNTIAVHVVP